MSEPYYPFDPDAVLWNEQPENQGQAMRLAKDLWLMDLWDGKHHLYIADVLGSYQRCMVEGRPVHVLVPDVDYRIHKTFPGWVHPADADPLWEVRDEME